MKTSRWLAPLFLGLSVTIIRAEDAGAKPTPPPTTTEIKSWRFEADMESRRGATLFQGETIDQVVAKLGEPRSRWKRKKDLVNLELRYVRKIPGPFTQKNIQTRDGSSTIRYQIVYIDESLLLFKNGTLHEVKTSRITADEAKQGLPPFMQ